MTVKGDWDRTQNSQSYQDGWERTFGKEGAQAKRDQTLRDKVQSILDEPCEVYRAFERAKRQ